MPRASHRWLDGAFPLPHSYSLSQPVQPSLLPYHVRKPRPVDCLDRKLFSSSGASGSGKRCGSEKHDFLLKVLHCHGRCTWETSCAISLAASSMWNTLLYIRNSDKKGIPSMITPGLIRFFSISQKLLSRYPMKY